MAVSAILLSFWFAREIPFRWVLKNLAKQKRCQKTATGKRVVGGNLRLNGADINEAFLALLQDHTAGDPMDETKKWTNLTCAKIGSLLAEKDFKVSRNIVRKLLKKNHYVKRKP